MPIKKLGTESKECLRHYKLLIWALKTSKTTPWLPLGSFSRSLNYAEIDNRHCDYIINFSAQDFIILKFLQQFHLQYI